MVETLLAIDIGNSRLKFAVFRNGDLLRQDYLPSLPEYADKICHEAALWNEEFHFTASIIASVSPRLGDLITTRIESEVGLTPFAVETIKQQLLPLKVDRPETVGVDRVVNCFAALHLYGAPAVIISMGTATTFEALSSDGEYLGGAIAPGVNISLEALTQRTALLPPAVWRKPAHLIAKNTLGHMESGMYYGSISLIEGMSRRMKQELGEDAKVIATGGISEILAEEDVFDVLDPALTLKGLNLIYTQKIQGKL